MNEIKKTADEFVLRIQRQAKNDKTGAEVLEIQAKALASLVSTQKTIAQLEENNTPEAKRKKALDYWLGKIGVSISVAGIVASIALLIDTATKRTELAMQTKTIASLKEMKDLAEERVKLSADMLETAEAKKKDADKAKEAAKMEAADATRKTAEAKEKEDDAKRNADKLSKQAEAVSKQLGESIKHLASNEAAKAELQAKLEEIKEDIDKGIKEREDLRTGQAKRNEKLVSLPRDVKAKLFVALGADDPVVVASQYQPAAEVAADNPSAEEVRIKKRVADLFSADGNKRGIAYDVLTNGRDRTNKALVPALIEAVKQKLEEYKAINLDKASKADREKAALIRRGLENAVVTLRDSSRDNTTRNPQNKMKLLELADTLTGVSYGVGEEAKRFKDWLNDANNG